MCPKLSHILVSLIDRKRVRRKTCQTVGLTVVEIATTIQSRPRVNGDTEKAVLAKRAEGTGRRKIARQRKIGVSTVNRILSEAA
jgi:DNA invertase Pin-like site-specific DNA recombinase